MQLQRGSSCAAGDEQAAVADAVRAVEATAVFAKELDRELIGAGFAAHDLRSLFGGDEVDEVLAGRVRDFPLPFDGREAEEFGGGVGGEGDGDFEFHFEFCFVSGGIAFDAHRLSVTLSYSQHLF